MRNAFCTTLVEFAADPKFVFLTGDLGYQALDPHGSSQIVTVEVPNPVKLTASLREHRIRCLASAGRMRVGFHYFNNGDDLEAVVAALKEGR